MLSKAVCLALACLVMPLPTQGADEASLLRAYKKQQAERLLYFRIEGACRAQAIRNVQKYPDAALEELMPDGSRVPVTPELYIELYVKDCVPAVFRERERMARAHSI